MEIRIDAMQLSPANHKPETSEYAQTQSAHRFGLELVLVATVIFSACLGFVNSLDIKKSTSSWVVLSLLCCCAGRGRGVDELSAQEIGRITRKRVMPWVRNIVNSLDIKKSSSSWVTGRASLLGY